MKWKKVLSLLLVTSMTSQASLAIAAENVGEENIVQETDIEETAETSEETAETSDVSADTQEETAEAAEEKAVMEDAEETAEAAEITEEADVISETDVPEAAEEPIGEAAEEPSEEAVTEAVEETDAAEATIKEETAESSEETVKTEEISLAVSEVAETEDYTEPVYVVSFEEEEAEEALLEEITKPVILLDAGSSDPRNIRDVQYVSIDTPVEINGETYQIVMAGIPEQYVDDLITFIKDYYKSVDPAKIEYSGTNNLIDAEKWSVVVSGVDSLLCWAATASNMLWNSGWADMAINPRTGKPFDSEDELFTYFTTRMTDGVGNTGSGIEWFFNALYDLQYDSDVTAAKLQETDAAADTDLPFLDPKDGIFPDLLVEKIQRFITINGDLSAVSVLKDLAYDAVDSKSIGLSLRFHNGEKFSGGHAVTAFGVIFDALASSAEAMYKAIILADSDNDADVVPEDLHISHFWEWMADKETRKNAYQIYHLKPIELEGTVYWEILDYTDDERKTVINGLYILDNYTDELKESITEEEGTCDFHKDYDLSLVQISTANDTYELGEEIEIALNFVNRSYFELDSEKIPDIPYSYRVIRDGEVVFTKTSWCNNVGLNPFSDNMETLTVNLQESIGSELPAGTYTIEFTINPCAEDNEIAEAFYQNNTKSITFTVVGTDEPDPVIPQPDPDPIIPDPGPDPVDPQPEPDPVVPEPAEPDPVEEKEPSYVTIPTSLIHLLEVENNGDWDLTKDEKDCFTVKVFHPASEFLDLVEIIKDEAGNTEEVQVEKENYRIEDNKETFTIEFSKEYLSTLEEGKHTYAISLISLFERLTFDVELKK